jgi:hypothetical protein
MTVLGIDFGDALAKGLRPDQASARNGRYLTECYNLRPTDDGLANHRPILAYGTANDSRFPHKQIFQTAEETILIGKFDDAEDKIAVVASPYDAGTTVMQDTYSATAVDVPKALLGDGLWQFASFGGTLFATNGHSMVFLNPRFGKWLAYGAVEFQSICNHDNRLLIGGFAHLTNAGIPRSENLLANGNFDGNANGWTLGAGWTYNSNRVNHTDESTADIQTAANVFQAGKQYFIKLETALMGSTLLSAGDGTNQIVLTSIPEAIDGMMLRTCLFTATADAPLHIRPIDGPPDFMHGSIDNVSVVEASGLWFDSDEWKGIWSHWIEHSSGEIITDESMAIGGNWVMWSTKAGGDIAWPFMNELAMFGIPDYTTFLNRLPEIKDLIARNEIGFVRMSWPGQIRSLKTLGKYVIVYGDNGISALVPGPAEGDGTGYQYREMVLSEVGVAKRMAADGGDGGHVFLDAAGWLWSIGPDLGLKRLGYREQMQPLLEWDHIVITNDAEHGEFYIAAHRDSENLNVGYHFGANGLSQVSMIPASLIVDAGDLVGTTNRVDQDTAFRLKTDQFDMKTRAIKTLSDLEVGLTGCSGAGMRVEARYDGAADFEKAPRVPLDNRGTATCVTAAVDFRLALDGVFVDGVNANIDELIVGYRMTDRRSMKRFLR